MQLAATRIRLTIQALAVAFLLAAPSAAIEELHSHAWDGSGEFLLSVADPARDAEVANDFDVRGLIERVVVQGANDCADTCVDPPSPLAVRLRFYEWTASGPGAVQADIDLLDGDPGFRHDAEGGAAMIDVSLPTPFRATGLHFLSVQLIYAEPFNWRRGPARVGAPYRSEALVRREGGPWETPIDRWDEPVRQDLAISLWGIPDDWTEPPPVAGCGEWVEIEAPVPPAADRSTIADFAVLSPTDAWAVGTSDRAIDGHWETREQSLVMRWNGIAWSSVPSPSPSAGDTPSATRVYLNAVAASGPDDAWAVGSHDDYGSEGLHVGSHVLALHWDGESWTDSDMPIPSDISAVQGASGDRLHDVVSFAADDTWMVGSWFVAESDGTVRWPGAAIHWNGSGFEVHEMPMVAEDEQQAMLGVDGVATDDLWVVGAGGGSQIYHWDGGNWTHVPGPAPGVENELHDVEAIASDDVWAGGWWRDEWWVQYPFITHWDGVSWSEVETPAGGQEIAVLGPDRMITQGVGGWASWDGTSWSEDRGPVLIPWGFVQALEGVSGCDAWVGGKKSAPSGQAPMTHRLVANDIGDPGDPTDRRIIVPRLEPRGLDRPLTPPTPFP